MMQSQGLDRGRSPNNIQEFSPTNTAAGNDMLMNTAGQRPEDLVLNDD
jgi:hypothetical protein